MKRIRPWDGWPQKNPIKDYDKKKNTKESYLRRGARQQVEVEVGVELGKNADITRANNMTNQWEKGSDQTYQ